MHEAGCAGRWGPSSWTESRAVRTAVRACSCSAGRGPSLAGCKVAGNALHDRPWAWPGRALQSRVSCAASCKQPTQIVVVASQDLPSHFRAPFRPGDCQRFPSGSCMAGTMCAFLREYPSLLVHSLCSPHHKRWASNHCLPLYVCIQSLVHAHIRVGPAINACPSCTRTR